MNQPKPDGTPAWVAALAALAPRAKYASILEDLPPLRLEGEERGLPHEVTLGLVWRAQDARLSAELLTSIGPLDGLDLASAQALACALARFWFRRSLSATHDWVVVLMRRYPSATLIDLFEDELRHNSYTRDCQKRAFGALARIDQPEAFFFLNRLSEDRTGHKIADRGRHAAGASRAHFGLSEEEYQDLCMPTLGIGPSGHRDLDYGPRTVRLRVVQGEAVFEDVTNGKAYKNLPRARKGDDEGRVAVIRDELQPSLKVLRKNVGRARARLERDMIHGRQWDISHVTGRLLAHPVVSQMMRGLVWRLGERDGEAILARPDEEGGFIDAEMEPVSLEGVGVIRVARISDLGDQLGPWLSHMEDFEVVQPIDQLADAVYAPDGPVVGELMRELAEGSFTLDVKVLKRLHKDGVVVVDGRQGFPDTIPCVGVVDVESGRELVALTGDLCGGWSGWSKDPVPVTGVAHRGHVPGGNYWQREKPSQPLGLGELAEMSPDHVIAFFKILASLRAR